MIEITSAILFVYSSLYGGPTINQEQVVATTSSMISIVEEAEVEIPNNIGLNKLVREYFSDTPLLAEIAKCESSFRQFDKNGDVLRGKVNRSDIGLMQVNEYYHGAPAKKLGFDIYTVDGNLAYAKWLYNREGGQPWKSSSPCWGKSNSSVQVAVAR